MSNVCFLKDAKIVPFSLDCKYPQDQYIHGIIHKDLTDSSRGLVRGERKQLLINELRLEEQLEDMTFKPMQGTTFYVGPFINQYGHLLAQTFSRAWAYKEYEKHIDNIVILGRSEKDSLENMPQYVLSMFDFFGFEREKIKFIIDPIICTELILAKQSHGIGFREEWYGSVYESIIKNKCLKDESFPEKIFISRRNYKYNGRLAGMDKVSSLLINNGYVEVYPEKLDLIEQIKLYINATHIVAEEGSALHTLDLIPKIKSKIFLIYRRRGYSTFLSLLNKVSDSVFYFDDVDVIESGERSANAMSISFSLMNLIECLQKNHFIRDGVCSMSEINKSILNDIASFYKKRNN